MMISHRPIGPSTNRASPLARSVIFFFAAVFGTTCDSLMSSVAQATGLLLARTGRWPALPASRAGVEVQIHGVERQADSHEVTHVDPHSGLGMIYVHVVCLYRQVEFHGFFQHLIAQVLVRLSHSVRAACKICHVSLQLHVVEVDGCEHCAESCERGKDRQGGRDAPARYLVHVRSPESFAVAQSSAQMSSECGVHSALDMPEICNSSSFSVPWP